MSLTPAFVPWAMVFFTLLLLNGSIVWLVRHEWLLFLLRRLVLGDLIVAWLGYAALYHLIAPPIPQPGSSALHGHPTALWILCAGIALYVLVRNAPGPRRRPEQLFSAAILAWSLVIAAGYNYIDDTSRDADRLEFRPETVLEGSAPDLPLLRRYLGMSRIRPEIRTATEELLMDLQSSDPIESARLMAFRLTVFPEMLQRYGREITNLHIYQAVQIGILAVCFLVWGFGRVPNWKTL